MNRLLVRGTIDGKQHRQPNNTVNRISVSGKITIAVGGRGRKTSGVYLIRIDARSFTGLSALQS